MKVEKELTTNFIFSSRRLLGQGAVMWIVSLSYSIDCMRFGIVIFNGL